MIIHLIGITFGIFLIWAILGLIPGFISLYILNRLNYNENGWQTKITIICGGPIVWLFDLALDDLVNRG
ncbi:MAG: hypothetical protein KBC33_01285 [Candidatus Pacebacteria bacterium]|nr:hypothetical protein [Candidatus Paceibacterota bacterium]